MQEAQDILKAIEGLKKMEYNPIIETIAKYLKQKRTVESLTFDLVAYLSKSALHTGKEKDRIALARITRATLEDESFANALAVVSGKMLDLFDK